MVVQENINSGYLLPGFLEWFKKNKDKIEKIKDIITKPVIKVFEKNSKKDTNKNKDSRRRTL